MILAVHATDFAAWAGLSKFVVTRNRDYFDKAPQLDSASRDRFLLNKSNQVKAIKLGGKPGDAGEGEIVHLVTPREFQRVAGVPDHVIKYHSQHLDRVPNFGRPFKLYLTEKNILAAQQLYKPQKAS